MPILPERRREGGRAQRFEVERLHDSGGCVREELRRGFLANPARPQCFGERFDARRQRSGVSLQMIVCHGNTGLRAGA